MINYRVALPEDFEKLIPFFRHHHQLSCYSNLEFSVRELIDSLTYCFLNPAMGRTFLAFDQGEVVGVCLAMMRTLITSKDIIAQETGLAVVERLKGSDVPKMLIDDFKIWARDNGAKMAMVNSSLGINNDRARAFFEKNGFEMLGYDLAEFY